MIILKDRVKTKYIGENQVVLDIETNGVNRKTSHIIIVGLLFNHREVKENFIQILIEDFKEEISMLRLIKSYLKDKIIITYNGQIFDLDFINTKLSIYGYNGLSYKRNLDLYRYLIKNKSWVDLNKYALQDLESYLSIKRFENFELDSDKLLYEKLKMHKSYQNLGKVLQDSIFVNQTIEEVLLHNRYDLLNTEKSLTLINIIEEEKELIIDEKFYYINSVSIIKDYLIIEILADLSENFSFTKQGNYLYIKDGILYMEINLNYGYVSPGQLEACIINKELAIKPNNNSYNLPDYVYLISDKGKLSIDNLRLLISHYIKEGIG